MNDENEKYNRFAEDAAKELPKHDVGVLNEVIDIIFELAERYK